MCEGKLGPLSDWRSLHNFFFFFFFFLTVCSSARLLDIQTGALFFIAMFWSFTPLFNSLTTFPAERAIIIKERASGSYRLSAYFLSKVVAEAPVELAYPVFFMLITYFMVSFHTSAGGFFFTVLTILLSTLCAQSYGLLISCTLLDFKQSITFASVSMLTLMLLSGFYVKLESIPVWLRWATYLVFRTRTHAGGSSKPRWISGRDGVGLKLALTHSLSFLARVSPVCLLPVSQLNTPTASWATSSSTTTISHAATQRTSQLEVRFTRGR